MKKKVVALLLGSAMVLSALTGCSSKKPETEKETKAATEATVETEAAEEETEAVEEAATEAVEEETEAVEEVATEAVEEETEAVEEVATEAVEEETEAVEEVATEAAEVETEAVTEAAEIETEAAEVETEAVTEAAEIETEAAEVETEAVTEAAEIETEAAEEETEAVTEAAEVETEAAEEETEAVTEAAEEVATEAVEEETEAVEEIATEAEEVIADEVGAEAVDITAGSDLNVRACIASEPETLDPNLESSVDGATYAMHLFETLMKYAPTEDMAGLDGSDNVNLLEVVPGQAESFDVSEDGLTYTFHLRDNIFWSDGQPVTAADFEYSWKRIVDPATAADYGYILDGIVVNASAIQAGEVDPSELGAVAVDDKTFEVTLEAECPYFEGLCAFAALMPLRQDVIEEYGIEWTNPGNMVSNGSYVLTDWVHDSYIEMTKNGFYYDVDMEGPMTLTWELNNSQTAQLAAFKAGEYDFFDDLPVDQIAELQDEGVAHAAPQLGDYYLYENVNNIPDWRVRAAISLCIDRENIVENVTQGGQTPATGLVPQGITNSEGAEWTETYGEVMYTKLAEMYPDADLETYSGRCDLAVQLVEEAAADGYDMDATIDYEYNTSEAHKAIAEAVQSDVSSVLGLNMELNNSEWQTYTNNLGEGKFGLARLGWIADFDDAVTYIELFTNGNSYNYGEWECDEYTDLINELKAMPGGAERDAKMVEAEEMLFGEGGFTVCPLYFYVQQYCINPNMKNVGWTPLGYFMFNHVTVEE